MATLAVAREFLSDYSKLDRVIQNRVHDLAGKCRLLSMAELNQAKGIHLETYKHQKDKRARTIRLGDNHRGIVLVPDGSDRVVLVDVMTHDDADRWMLNNEFKVNAATGALEVFDAGAIASQIEAVGQRVAATPEPAALLYDHRKDKDFTQLGIDESMLPLLRVMDDESQLEALMLVLPQGQAEALILLTGDESVDVIYAQVAGNIDPEEIDTDDLAAAIVAPASRAHFHVVTDEDDLAEMLARPLAQWRTYLHQSQHEIAYRPTYNGPARVTGGAGTGKTVVAMHRAKALAENLEGSTSRPILFTTFTRNLAQAIERDLRLLGGSDLLDVTDVVNVDRLANQMVKDIEGSAPQIIQDSRLLELWDEKILELGYDLTPTFVLQEWEQVVLAQGLDSRDEYFRASRAGRGTRLDRKQRAQVWKVIEAATREMESRNVRTHLQVAAKAAGYMEQEQIKPYQHVIVDEAQDLHEAQWRLLRAVVGEGENDLFIVGDSHQRIYGRRSSLSKVGINIRGRSKKLKINYRTTRQILRWSLAVLGEGEYDDLDEGTDNQDVAGYHSFLDGAVPTCVGFATRGEMIEGLAERVKQWIAEGVDESAIGIAARTKGTFPAVERALRDVGVLAFELGPDLSASDGVAIGTMHRMKGLEYRCVAVIDASSDELPNPKFLTPESEDPVQHEAEIRRERSLLYVASTRARDDLWVAWSGSPSRFLTPVLGI
ncbi:UvrD-helicase domain-containing protein [Rhabdothermincola salaria]|uniref:UvrD-helicase domain-containing protein n=1 Tax=Rhabdothermincola salaria TaxID=2903142 RepID=UPI001E4F2B05|nr:UvrD-helicase domain-containing protein [Rhabdothermincola salaria]MCD9625294.1 AAA family ATPase [Rhabdothermincola salaria]